MLTTLELNKRNIYLVLIAVSDSWDPWNSLLDKISKGEMHLFGCSLLRRPFQPHWVDVNEVTSGTPQDGGQLSGEPTLCDERVGTFRAAPPFQGRERVWMSNQAPVANDLPLVPLFWGLCKNPMEGIWRASGLADTWRCQAGGAPRVHVEALQPCPLFNNNLTVAYILAQPHPWILDTSTQGEAEAPGPIAQETTVQNSRSSPSLTLHKVMATVSGTLWGLLMYESTAGL